MEIMYVMLESHGLLGRSLHNTSDSRACKCTQFNHARYFIPKGPRILPKFLSRMVVNICDIAAYIKLVR